MTTKRDLKRLEFERNEQQHWNKIIQARSRIDNDSLFTHYGAPVKMSIRNKKPIQLDEGKSAIASHYQ